MISTDKHTSERQVALITGAAVRIGAAIARSLHSAGMDLMLHYRSSRSAALKLQKELLEKRDNSVELIEADLATTCDFSNLFSQVQDFRGRLDVLVNNASSFYPTPIGLCQETDWNELLGSNLRGPFFLTQSLVPILKKSRGTIINLIDIHADRPLKDHPLYCMAKAGNAMMVKSLARDLGPEIRVNGVAPGLILWPEEEDRSEELKRLILNRTVLKRSGNAEEVARAVLFLVRDATYTTGHILTLDGGRSLQQ